jgi:putative endonuclease
MVLTMPWFVYILECSGDRLYVGITTDVVARFSRHLAGDAAALTRKHPPVRMIFW